MNDAAVDLHLKMSKKIAQLTKVIFHLNTRNEDFQMEFAHTKKVHAGELQQLTLDAATKLRLLQEQLQTQTNVTMQWERQATKEKERFTQEFKKYQDKMQARQTTMEQEFKQKITELENQVVQNQRTFQERLQQLTKMAETQQQRASVSSSATTAVLKATYEKETDELRAKHTEEVTQLVMMSNTKYNQMLAEQLRLQDALKEELTKAKVAWEQQVLQLQTEHTNQISAQSQSAKETFDNMKHQLVSKIEKLLAESEVLRGHETKLRQEKDAFVQSQSELQRHLKQLELEVTKAEHETQSVRKDAEMKAQNLQERIILGTEKIDQLAQELEALRSTLQLRDQALMTAQKDLEAAQMETLQRNMNLSEKSALFNQQVKDKELQIANLDAQLRMASQQFSMMETTLQKKIQTLEATVTAKEGDISGYIAKLAAGDLKISHLQKENEKLLAEMTRKTTEYHKELEQLKEKQAKHLQEAASSHASEMQSQNEETSRQLERLEAQLKEKSTVLHEQTIQKLQAEHSAALEKEKAGFEAIEAKLKLELVRLETEAKSIETRNSVQEKELADSKKKYADLTSEMKKRQERIMTLENEKEQQQKTSQKSQKEKDDMYQKRIKELTTQNESSVKKLMTEKEQLQQQHTQTLLNLAREHEIKIKKLQGEWELLQQAQLTSQTTQLGEFYELQLAALRDELHQNQAQLARMNQEAQEMQRSLEEIALYEKEDLRSCFVHLASKFAVEQAEQENRALESMEDTLKAHAKELEALASRLTSERDELLAASRADAETRAVQLALKHRQELQVCYQQHSQELQDQRETLVAKHNCEVLALRAEAAQKLRDAAMQKDRQREEALMEAQSRHNTEYGLLQKEAELIRSALKEKTFDYNNSTKENERLSNALDAKTKEMTEKIVSLEKSNREHIEMLKKAAKMDMDRLLEENLAETKLLSDQFEETKRLMVDKVTFLKQTISEWEDRYARRESRPEDVSRIADLERLVVEKEALVRQTLDEMAYFKRELLNREEMYNKTFARTPNVGVMQVLKPHVQLQAQMQQQTNTAPQLKRKTKPSTSGRNNNNDSNSVLNANASEELQRRNSISGGSNNGMKKSLPPLNNNQIVM